jgi:hypothetical protein
MRDSGNYGIATSTPGLTLLMSRIVDADLAAAPAVGSVAVATEGGEIQIRDRRVFFLVTQR